MTDKNIQYAAWVVVVIAILIAGYFGVQYPIPDPPTIGDFSPQAVTNFDALTTSGALSVGGASTLTGNVSAAGTLAVTGASTLTGDVTASGIINAGINDENIGLPSILSTEIISDANNGALWTVGAGEIWLVTDVKVNVTTNFDCTGDCTLILGDGNDTDGFCTLADAELQAADTEGTGWEAGWQCQVAATRGAYIDGTGGFVYEGAETIDIAVAGTALAAGEATIYLMYTRLQ